MFRALSAGSGSRRSSALLASSSRASSPLYAASSRLVPTAASSSYSADGSRRLMSVFSDFKAAFGRREKYPWQTVADAPPPKPKREVILEQDDLFHPISVSPFEDLRLKAERMKMMAPCPVCLDHFGERNLVKFDSPIAGYPTHCSEEHYLADDQHHLYAERLREVNEEEHDIRSGRELVEFENMPGFQDYQETINMSNWDTLFYTRHFPSMDNMRVYRNVTKVLTYPMTMATVMHQLSPYQVSNGRVTKEGQRSLAALQSTLHPVLTPKPIPGLNNVVRIFVLGARHESSLPSVYYEQLARVYPKVIFKIYHVGPQAAMPGNWTAQEPAFETDRDDPLWEAEMEKQRAQAEAEAKANGTWVEPEPEEQQQRSGAYEQKQTQTPPQPTPSPSRPTPSDPPSPSTFPTSKQPQVDGAASDAAASAAAASSSSASSSSASNPHSSTFGSSSSSDTSTSVSSTNSSSVPSTSFRNLDELPLDSPDRERYPYNTFERGGAPSEAPLPKSISSFKLSSTLGSYGPTKYLPPTPKLLSVNGPITKVPGRDESENYGVPAWTIPVTPEIAITNVQAPYERIHDQFGPFDPYSDVFFAFHPGFGFPSSMTPGKVQVQPEAEWGDTLPLVLQTKCPLFVTGFSPADVERDVKSLEGVPGVDGEFDWILNPGENFFCSEQWDVAEFDPRVLVKSNWGIWGIRGKMNEVQEVDQTGWGLVR